ncbi:MAG: ImmA/IrrE family metallo-endopeptidase [Phycisphaerales bacterium]|nr:ImmA/IrrE family metallo-endopeptidase [Phycisphaerales bacterium]
MNRAAYYNSLKDLARAKRLQYGLTTPRVQRSHLRAIYRDEGIRIDLWPHRLREVRGAYFNDEIGPTVMLVKGLPEDPMVFTMAHELKHHLVDRELPVACCSDRNANEHIEIGAEIFAAEFIFPEEEFAATLARQGVAAGSCSAEDLVRLKHDTRTTLSYAGLAKRAVFMNLALPAALANVRWKKLEEQMFGEPLYKQIQRRRSRYRST